MPELYPIVARYPGNGSLYIRFIDIGQGCCAYVICPNGKRLLIDCGSDNFQGLDNADVAGELDYAFPFVDRSRANLLYVDVVILSHGDQDHYNKLPDLVGESSIQQLYYGGLGADYTLFKYRSWWWKKMNIDIREVNGQAVWRTDSINVNAASPAPVMLCDGTAAGGLPCEVWAIASNVAAGAGESRTNANSLVVKIVFGGSVALITGDAMASTEAFMVNNQAVSNIPLRSNLLLVPHHGSDTSSTQAFIDAVYPEEAVISAKEENGHGLPKIDIVNRYIQPQNMLDVLMIVDTEEEHLIGTYNSLVTNGNSNYNPMDTDKCIWQTGTNGTKRYQSNGQGFFPCP